MSGPVSQWGSRDGKRNLEINGKSLDSVPGWFWPHDVLMFDWLLSDQDERGLAGDLVEIGTYYGKSAVLIGSHKRPDEQLTVVDLYETPPEDDANKAEQLRHYGGLTRADFERTYLQFHDELPAIVQGKSSEIRSHVRADTVRFCHVDGSHHYEHVRGDVEAAREMLRPSGIVVFDDYRTAHTPGVAAAVWEAVFTTGLKPFAITHDKLYGSWSDLEEVSARLLHKLAHEDSILHDIHTIAGHRLIRLYPMPSFTARATGRVKRDVSKSLRRLARR